MQCVLFGYKYTDFASSAAELQKEAVKRIRELKLNRYGKGKYLLRHAFERDDRGFLDAQQGMEGL